ncbi:MAG: STAS domain-containing protein [Phycisphaerae bacterium]|nr:STAS domain-containing protein [Phycisphaerae bacterium]
MNLPNPFRSSSEKVDARRGPANWREAVDALNAVIDSPFLVDVLHSGSAIVVHPGGPGLAEREVTRIHDAFDEALAHDHKGLRFVVLDLSDVRGVSAYGLGLCSDLAKRAKEAGLEPILVGASRDVLDGLRMFKADRLYHVVRSRRDLADKLASESELHG